MARRPTPIPSSGGHPLTGRRPAALLAAVALLALAGCEASVQQQVDAVRKAAGRPALAHSATLNSSAKAKAQAMCNARRATPSADPLEAHDQESALAIHELVGSARLDPAVADAGGRNAKATNEVWARWRTDPALKETRWDDLGVGEVTCADGRLYLAAVLRDRPSMPATGRYSSPQYGDGQIAHTAAIVYGTAVDSEGHPQQLLLDLYVPPTVGTALRPATISIHGGGFVGGSRSTTNEVARQWALRGYVGLSIDYRLDRRPGGVSAPGGQNAAALDGIDDGMEAVRWLKAHAAELQVDTGRILTQGYSAGGAISLGVALGDDPTPGGPYGAYSPSVAAAISTGAHLTPGLASLHLSATDPPVQMYVYEHDETGFTSDYAFQTCAAVRAAGATCDFVLQPGSGHTAWLTPGAPLWTAPMGPWTWTALRLH